MDTTRFSAVQDAKLTMGSFLIVTGLFALMFHVILFPIIGIVMGVFWAGASLISIARPVVRQNNRETAGCSPGIAWQKACR